MSFFLGNNINNFTSMDVDPEKIKIAEIQFEAMAVTFNKMMDSCHKKCIPSEYGESELNKGESTCIDRCVSKYTKANVSIGKSIQQGKFGFDVYESMPNYKIARNQLKKKDDNLEK